MQEHRGGGGDPINLNKNLESYFSCVLLLQEHTFN